MTKIYRLFRHPFLFLSILSWRVTLTIARLHSFSFFFFLNTGKSLFRPARPCRMSPTVVAIVCDGSSVGTFSQSRRQQRHSLNRVQVFVTVNLLLHHSTFHRTASNTLGDDNFVGRHFEKQPAGYLVFVFFLQSKNAEIRLISLQHLFSIQLVDRHSGKKTDVRTI